MGQRDAFCIWWDAICNDVISFQKFLIDYTAMHIQCVQLAFSKVANSHRNASGVHQREKSLSPSGVQYEVGNSTQLCQSSPENRPLPDASSINCDGFLVSTYSKLYHVTWRLTILLRCLGEQQSQRRLLFGHRQPFVRNDVIANGVSPYTECIALTSKLQRIAVVRNPSSSVVI